MHTRVDIAMDGVQVLNTIMTEAQIMHVAHTQEAATIFYLNFKTLLGHHVKVSVFELRGGGDRIFFALFAG